MTRRRLMIGPGPAPTEAELLRKEAVLRANVLAVSDANKALCQERAQRAVDWIIHNHPALTFGISAEVLRISDDDSFGLADLEDHGRAGNAVRLHQADFGEVWWCDPEGRAVTTHRFVVFAKGSHEDATYLIRFTKS